MRVNSTDNYTDFIFSDDDVAKALGYSKKRAFYKQVYEELFQCDKMDSRHEPKDCVTVRVRKVYQNG